VGNEQFPPRPQTTGPYTWAEGTALWIAVACSTNLSKYPVWLPAKKLPPMSGSLPISKTALTPWAAASDASAAACVPDASCEPLPHHCVVGFVCNMSVPTPADLANVQSAV